MWLNENLQNNIRTVFEKRYKRVLTKNEIVEIGENLEAVMEEILKFKWRQKYEKITG